MKNIEKSSAVTGQTRKIRSRENIEKVKALDSPHNCLFDSFLNHMIFKVNRNTTKLVIITLIGPKTPDLATRRKER